MQDAEVTMALCCLDQSPVSTNLGIALLATAVLSLGCAGFPRECIGVPTEEGACLPCPEGAIPLVQSHHVWCALPDGTEHGPFVYLDKDGETERTGNYEKGKRHGRFLTFEWGSEIEEENYVHGVRHGPREWLEGPTHAVGAYRDGEKDGPWVYEDRGRKERMECYVSGLLIAQCEEINCVVDCALPDGPLLLPGATGEMRGGLPVGTWTVSSREEQETVSFVDGRRDGPYVHKHGKYEETRGTYVAGQKEGEWTFFEKGKLAKRTRYHRGYQGLAESFHRDGSLSHLGCSVEGRVLWSFDEYELPDPLPDCPEPATPPAARSSP